MFLAHSSVQVQSQAIAMQVLQTNEIYMLTSVSKYLLLTTSICISFHAIADSSAPAKLGAGDSWQPLFADVLNIAGDQLSAALTQAYAAHIKSSRPLPPEVKTLLHGIVPENIIERARFTVSNDEQSLPGLLNLGNRVYMHQDNAVSIDNLIIFSREPTLDKATDARWWAHELGHHLQYQQLGGITGFAHRYVQDYEAMERDAENFGEKAMHKYIDLHR